MAQDLLNNCAFDGDKLKTLWIGSRLVDGNPITYPLEYQTVSGTSDSVIAVTNWDFDNSIVTIGGQQVQVNEITNTGDNISFEETYVVNANGKVYQKKISFIIPNIQIFLVNQLKEFTISSAGQFALSPTICFIVDENDNYLVVGYDKALYLQNTDFIIGDENQVTLSYQSTSQSRARAYQII